VIYRIGEKPKTTPRFNSAVAFGNLIIAGVGYHQAGDIKVHTKAVLDSIRKQLESAWSSMEKVLKVNVFGDEPPVRTAIAAAGGIPGDSSKSMGSPVCRERQKSEVRSQKRQSRAGGMCCRARARRLLLQLEMPFP
jgi:hypothetical protein